MIGRTLSIALLSALACLGQEQTATLTGSVTDPFGSPIKKVRAQLESEDRNSPPISVKGDDSGRFRFTNLPPATYRLGVYSPAFKTAFRSGIRLLAGQQFSIPNIVLDLDTFSRGDPTIDAVQPLAPGDDSGTLRGSVLDSSGSPVEGAIVSVNCAGCVIKTNQEGQFTFSDLRPGSYVVAISMTGFYREFLPHYGVFKNLDWTYAPVKLERCLPERCERIPKQEKILPQCQ